MVDRRRASYTRTSTLAAQQAYSSEAPGEVLNTDVLSVANSGRRIYWNRTRPYHANDCFRPSLLKAGRKSDLLVDRAPVCSGAAPPRGRLRLGPSRWDAR